MPAPSTNLLPADHLAALRAQLGELLRGRSAHLDMASVFGGVADDHWGVKPEGSPHTLWQLLEHTRFTLQDLYLFSTDDGYKAPEWPKEYWPGGEAPESFEAVQAAYGALEDAQNAMLALVANPAVDLFAAIPWGDGQTILREALLAADHTSYHLGQAMILRKQLEAEAVAE